jgi:hypothetical protein
VSADAFEVLLRYLYAQELPDGGDKGEKLGEYAKTADRFQAPGLYGNVVILVCACIHSQPLPSEEYVHACVCMYACMHVCM